MKNMNKKESLYSIEMPTNGDFDGYFYAIGEVPIFTYGMITATVAVLAYMTAMEPVEDDESKKSTDDTDKATDEEEPIEGEQPIEEQLPVSEGQLPVSEGQLIEEQLPVSEGEPTTEEQPPVSEGQLIEEQLPVSEGEPTTEEQPPASEAPPQSQNTGGKKTKSKREKVKKTRKRK